MSENSAACICSVSAAAATLPHCDDDLASDKGGECILLQLEAVAHFCEEPTGRSPV